MSRCMYIVIVVSQFRIGVMLDLCLANRNWPFLQDVFFLIPWDVVLERGGVQESSARFRGGLLLDRRPRRVALSPGM